MTKIGNINFDDRIFSAIRDGKLVIFAGAGVSMGEPSNLPSYEKLAQMIASGTGREAKKPYDKFLGQLEFHGVPVHKQAAGIFASIEGKPTTLHRDLLRLFRVKEHVRIVTTNYDHHFTTAANSLFDGPLKEYISPALPKGGSFSGIVHIHGRVSEPECMILTDSDLGRAYLVDGYACRFLVETLKNYTVLFIGYSFDDYIVNFITRALPKENTENLFILSEEDKDWEFLGLNAIRFALGTENDSYSELNRSINILAERVNRGVLDWGARLSEICCGLPPIDEEVVSEIQQALSEVPIAKQFTKATKGLEWPLWLDTRKHLDALFERPVLDEISRCFAHWLTENYCVEHPKVVFNLLAAHGTRLNRELWELIAHKLIGAKERIETNDFRRWATILLANATEKNSFILLELAKGCADKGMIDLSLRAFLIMGGYQLILEYDTLQNYQDPSLKTQETTIDYTPCSDQWELSEVWTKCLKTNISQIHHPLIASIIRLLEMMHRDLGAWNKAYFNWDSTSILRPAIEPDVRNRFPKPIDVLIDATRDTLEWLSENSPQQLEALADYLVKSDVPILRRLAIQAIADYSGKTEDDRLKWLMSRLDIFGNMETHEVHRFIANNYQNASEDIRRQVVEAIIKKETHAQGEITAEVMTDRFHFDWLSWLQRSKADCDIVKEEISSISRKYPDWQPSENPKHYVLWIEDVNVETLKIPWSTEELHEMELSTLVSSFDKLQQSDSFETNLEGLVDSISDICVKYTDWSLRLAYALINSHNWSSELWGIVLRCWQRSDLSIQEWKKVLEISSQVVLNKVYLRDIASILNSITKDGGKPFALELLAQADLIALAIWENELSDIEQVGDWLFAAVNSPSGIVVEYWLNSLLVLLHKSPEAERSIPEYYKLLFGSIINEPKQKGGYGRCLLASQVEILFKLDSNWTLKSLIPLFANEDWNVFCQVWEGFLVYGRQLSALEDALISAIDRFTGLPQDYRERFVEKLTTYAVYYIDDPTKKLLPLFLAIGSVEDKRAFSSQLGFLLRQMEPMTKTQLWTRWLCNYWENRIAAKPLELIKEEVEEMLEWLPYLGESFSSAISLAISLPVFQIDRTNLLYELINCDLPLKHPEDIAKLIIHLSKCLSGIHYADLIRLKNIIEPLINDPKLLHDFKEGLASVGIV